MLMYSTVGDSETGTFCEMWQQAHIYSSTVLYSYYTEQGNDNS